jgi:hypothetical protein
MNEVVIKQDKKKAIKLLILGSIMLLVSIFVFLNGVFDEEILYVTIGIIATLFFGACFMFIAKSTLSDKPLLLIGQDGITDMSTASSIGFIAWEEIKSIYVQKSFNQKFIGINIYDLDKLMKRISLLRRTVIKINLILKFPPVAINLDTADIEFNEALLLIEKNLEHHKIHLR